MPNKAVKIWTAIRASIHWCPRCPDTLNIWPCGVHLYVDTLRKVIKVVDTSCQIWRL